MDEDRQAKNEAAEERMSFARLFKAAIKIQAHWRGFIARKDYARYKQITQLKSKTNKAKKNVKK